MFFFSTDATCRSVRTVRKGWFIAKYDELKRGEESENSNSAIQSPPFACRIPASMHVNPGVPKCRQLYPARSRFSSQSEEDHGSGRRGGGTGWKREEDEGHGRLATSQDGCRWHQRCGARPVKISSQARISATPAARKGSERDGPNEERIVERGVYVRRAVGVRCLRGEERAPASKGRRSFLSSWPRALIGGRGRLQPPCYHDYRRDNPAAAD